MNIYDIGRMLKMAKVPQSKTVEILYPNPRIELYIPVSHYMITANVVGMLARDERLNVGNMSVHLLESKEVRAGEHVWVKVRGVTQGQPTHDDGSDAREQRRRRSETLRQRNSAVVIDCISTWTK